ncbi:YhgE/Pip domain-containing protein [Lysinibacillus telephonicus]|uniref:YhgE/Pip domain-containing protein n=1 Tax=Lysinibacillus telephonicus TaxID=1714840 RepID=UPI0031FDD7E6
MKASWTLYLNDIKNIGRNWVAAVLIGGLILLPSLYAWLNIEASMDPYGQTDQIPIAIVNEDKGTVVRDQSIHVGNDIVASLKENKSMDWHFVNRETAIDKLKYGDYYAAIIIPSNFSKRLGSVISDNPEKANVEYYVNEKLNAIAPKITEKGASVIVQQISNNFISTVNGIIFELFNEIGIELEKNLPDIEKFESYIFTMEENLPEIYKIINDTTKDAEYAEKLIHQAQGVIPKVSDASSNGIQIIDNTSHLLQEAEVRMDEIVPQIDKELVKIQSVLADTNNFVKNIDTAILNHPEGNQINDVINERVNNSLQSIDNISNILTHLQLNSNGQENGEEPNGNERINAIISELERIKQNLYELQGQANEQDSFLEDRQKKIDGWLSNIAEKTEMANSQIDTFMKDYNERIKPAVNEKVNNAKKTLAQARQILLSIQSTIPEVEKMLNRTANNLSKGKETLRYVSKEFPYVNDKVNELADRLRNIQEEADINEIIQLLQNDPEAERGFFAEPVVLKEYKLFSIPNYGTGMTPFYTVLSIWVGGLLLISLLSTEVHPNEAYSGRTIYFGRMFTFMTIGFFQTIIVTLGNIFILPVEISEPFWFVVFGLFCSLVFIMIVYTLVSVFGDVGKALAIILLVLQIAGSGGTYPVVLLPEFFQIINPFLPFTYAISLMREAVGGIIWEKVMYDVLFLLLFGLIALVLGGFLKEMINKQTDKLKEKSKESGLFH